MQQVCFLIRLLDLSIELCDKKQIFKIISEMGSFLFLDELTKSSFKKGFARVCVLMDTDLAMCPGVRIKVKINLIWQ